MPEATLPPALWDTLKATSRSFYLSLRWLPGATRGPVGLAYLLARLADTVADTDALAAPARIAWLEAFRIRLADPATTGLDLAGARAAGAGLTPGERRLLDQAPAVLAAYDAQPAAERAASRRVLERIAAGMAMDLERFADGTAQAPRALATRADLDRYCYLVAGCVGEYWTEIHALHVPRVANRARDLVPLGVRFGMGLQLINILRDLPADLTRGRCYLPARDLAACGLAPADLASPGAGRRLRPATSGLIALAAEHLRAGWTYLELLPASERRLRLTCAWPLLIGIRTLGRLARSADPLGPDRIKIRRAEVTRLVLESSLRSVIPPALGPMWRRELAAAAI